MPNLRVVAFGGTFDPVHNGHVAIARHLRDVLHPETVLVIPAGQPWLREQEPIASPSQRLKMASLAFEGEAQIAVSDVDIKRQGTTYSFDTISDLRAIYGATREIVLALGSDAVTELPRWHLYEELLDACTLAIVQRPGTRFNATESLPPTTILTEGPKLDVSATALRSAYGARDYGRVGALIPAKVHAFILESGLYR